MNTKAKPNRIKKPTSVTLHPGVISWANQIIREGSYSNMSELVSDLIRTEWSRRHAPGLLHEPPTDLAKLKAK